MCQEQYFKWVFMTHNVAIILSVMIIVSLISLMIVRAIVRYTRTHKRIKRIKESCETCKHKSYCEESLSVRVCSKFEEKE